MPFEFIARGTRFDMGKGPLLVIPDPSERKRELLSRYAEGLRLPDWFGMNWDALEECLCDRNLAGGAGAVIVHEGLPFRRAQRSLAPYLGVLDEAVKANPDLRVIFPAEFEVRIKQALREV